MTVIATGFDHRGRGAPRAPRDDRGRAARPRPADRRSPALARSRSPTTTSTSRRSCARRVAAQIGARVTARRPGHIGAQNTGSSFWGLRGVRLMADDRPTCRSSPPRIWPSTSSSSRAERRRARRAADRPPRPGLPHQDHPGQLVARRCGASVACRCGGRRRLLDPAQDPALRASRRRRREVRPVRRLGDAGPVRGISAEHLAVRAAAASSTSRTWARSRRAAREAEALLQRLLSNDVAKIPVGGAQYSVLCREDGGVLDDLFTYRLEPDRYLTVTNAANHDKDLAWFRGTPRASTSTSRTRTTTTRCSPSRARGARDRPGDLRRAAARPLDLPPAHAAGARSLVCGTGYTGEDGVELLVRSRGRGRALGRAAAPRRRARRPGRPRHPAPRGLLPPLRQRPDGGARPDRGRAGLVLQGGHRLHRLRGGPRGARGRPRREARRRSS